MELSPEDQLRLNVMLANPFDAVRVDESRMTVHALTGTAESRVQLNPNCRHDRYLKQVRELLSGHVLGSPGGYPVFLRRWTRMGQARADNLAELLKLGEPEAVTAVAGAADLTNELARRAWWACPTSDIARRMLRIRDVAQGSMGKVLAEHLVEHLPFETESALMIETVELVLQPGLIDEDTREKLWSKGKHKRAYHIGFLRAVPEGLPEPAEARADLESHRPALTKLAGGNPVAATLLKLLDAQGQAFLVVLEAILKKPGNQDDVVALLNAMRDYLVAARVDTSPCQDIEAIVADCRKLSDSDFVAHSMLAEIMGETPGLRNELAALLVLTRSDEAIVTPIFARTTAIGTVMRRKLEPVTTPLLEQIRILRGTT